MSIAEKFEVIADEVYEKGKQDEYDRFWDEYQQDGKRFAYYYAFAGICWNDETFKPKYDINLNYSAINVFTYANITDLKGILEGLGRKLDTSKASSLSSFFSDSKVTRVPVIDCSGANSITNLFTNCSSLTYVEKLILTANLEYAVSMFTKCSKLEHMIVEGTIARKGFNVSPCVLLDKDSLLSILKALSLDITATTTITFSTEHQATIETDTDCQPYWEAAKAAGWSFVYA